MMLSRLTFEWDAERRVLDLKEASPRTVELGS
jgi:hypothetical protein